METIERTETYSLELDKKTELSITYKDKQVEVLLLQAHEKIKYFKHERVELKLINGNLHKIVF